MCIHEAAVTLVPQPLPPAAAVMAAATVREVYNPLLYLFTRFGHRIP